MLARGGTADCDGVVVLATFAAVLAATEVLVAVAELVARGFAVVVVWAVVGLGGVNCMGSAGIVVVAFLFLLVVFGIVVLD